MVPGLGEEAGAALSAHPGVAHLSFTGSVAVGRLVQAAAAQNTIPVTLELGGKSPQLVFADADLDAALPFLVNAGIQNAGQTCSAGSRILVERSRLDEVVQRMAGRYRTLRVGPALDDLDVGPLISARQRDVVERYLAFARDSGLAVVAQAPLGSALPAGGFYVRPTLLAPVSDAHRLAQEEIFGPVQVVIPFEDEAGAIAIANGTAYGLVAGVWTRDGGRALRVAPLAQVRPGLRQQLRRRRRRRAAVRRRQVVRPRPREGLRGAVWLLDAEDGGHPPRLRKQGMRLNGKVAIVTGGGSGFGAGIVRKFVAEGAQVLVADLNVEAANAVADSVGASARAMRVDVSDAADVRAMIGAAEVHFGRLDILVNNAGIGHLPQPLEALPEEQFDRLFAVNMKAIYLAMREVVPRFKAQKGGVVLNMASTAGVSPRPRLAWYNASKGWVITATRASAVELAPFGIRVNALNPVAGETPLLATFMGEDTPEMRAKFLATIPLGRFSTPEDLGNAACFLCSDEASMITGVCMEVDGGRCI